MTRDVPIEVGRTAVGVPIGVGRTALGVAMVRAMESRRRDRLFHDPYAAAFLAAAPAVFDRAQRGAVAGLGGLSSAGAAFWSHALIRTRFFDDYLLDATGRRPPADVAKRSPRSSGRNHEAQGIRQVVLLAAGLDTRAYRLAWPAGVWLFELDLAEVLEFKRRVLGEQAAVPRCDHRPVPADLRADWTGPLTRAGLRPDEPTGWLLEGLLIYLSAEETTGLLTTVGELSAAGSRMAFEFEETDADTLREQARRVPAIAEYVALWKGGLPDVPGWLAAHGWLVEKHNGADVTTRYGRAAGPSRGGFVTAIRA